jgi:hypothetical protein
MTRGWPRLLIGVATAVTACSGAAYTASNTVEPTNAGETAVRVVTPLLAAPGSGLCSEAGAGTKARSPSPTLTETASTLAPNC